RAIANGEFVVFYQPKVACADVRVVAAEALVRWKHPSKGLLLPAAFLPVAEEAGLVAELSWHVLERAAMEMSNLARGDQPISLAVNVSATQFEQVDFAERVASILDRSGLAPARLELELTESLAMHDPERVIERMGPLKRRGVRFAIDDFGTGYSSLSYLTRLPIDTVKIDRSFIRAARDSATDRALVTTIFHMAESLKFQTVAEGIETEEDLAFVRKHGAVLAQGFLFSPPMPYQEFALFCRTFRRRSLEAEPITQLPQAGTA
ncbi:MAG TPA: EAL domain-containing protein, partial [Beijerinckiaceae bacterium]|nr:EAL domain-containing protein [Beijerinckiaceae bacterium]